jgi:hypothetical protein
MKAVRLSGLRTGRLYHPGIIPGTHFCSRLSRPQSHSVAGRIVAVRSYWVWWVSPSVVRCNSNLCTCSGYGEREIGGKETDRRKERKKCMNDAVSTTQQCNSSCDKTGNYIPKPIFSFCGRWAPVFVSDCLCCLFNNDASSSDCIASVE